MTNTKPTKLDMTAILDSYTQEVIKENKRRQAIRQQYSEEMNDIADIVFDGVWNISDRD